MTQACGHSHADLIYLSARNNRVMSSIKARVEDRIDPEEQRAAMGKRISDLRLRFTPALSQPALAAMADITQPSLWAIEKGQTKEVTARTLFALCRALGTTVEYLWAGSDQSVEEAMDEAELVAIYRQLLPAGRAAILQSARSVLAAQPSPRQKDEAGSGEKSPRAGIVTETSTFGGGLLHRVAPSLSSALSAPRKMAAKGKTDGTQRRQDGGVQKPRTRRNT